MDINDKYEEFYRRGNASKAFSKFCTSTFGIDLSQDGFADKEQLDTMIEFAGIHKDDICLDIGCGNGKIDEYINSKTRARIHGVDYSKNAIRHANDIALRNGYLKFSQGDVNSLSVTDDTYTKILLLDSIYFSNDYTSTLTNLYDALKPGGILCLCYSEFVFDKNKQNRKIEYDETRVAEVIHENDWEFQYKDLIASHFELMKRKNKYCAMYKDDFESEDNIWLYEKLRIESVGEDMDMETFSKLTNRYIYCIQKK